jgi:hypothetical protein
MRAYTTTHTLLDNRTATSTGTPMLVAGLGSVALQVTLPGSGEGTITFQGSADGVNYVTLEGTDLNSGTAGTITSAAGLWRFDTRGLTHLRGSISAYAAGTINMIGVGYAD